MKIYASIENENGAIVSKGGNESLTILLKHGNHKAIELHAKVIGDTLTVDGYAIQPEDRPGHCSESYFKIYER